MLALVNCRSYKRILQRILDTNRSLNFHLYPALAKVACKPSKSTPDQCGCSSPSSGSGGGGSGEKGKHQVTYKPYEAPCYIDHDHKNMGLKRPMSPHLTIYAPTTPAMTSIAQRITGVVLSFYAVMLSAGTLFLSNGVESYIPLIQSLDLSRPMIFLIKLIMGFPFAFHYFFGIRFVMWNVGRWLTMKEVNETVKPLFIGTAVMSFLFALL